MRREENIFYTVLSILSILLIYLYRDVLAVLAVEIMRLSQELYVHIINYNYIGYFTSMAKQASNLNPYDILNIIYLYRWEMLYMTPILTILFLLYALSTPNVEAVVEKHIVEETASIIPDIQDAYDMAWKWMENNFRHREKEVES